MGYNVLKKPAYIPLRMNEIHPRGWIKQQLRIQADGLSGHLDEFWNDIKNSQWFGGASESWERAPYWLDGVIPLSCLLEDKKLINKVSKYIDYVINHQSDDGWLGPRNMVPADGAQTVATYDLWAQFLILKALVQFYDATNDERVPDVIEKNLKCIDLTIDRAPIFNWAQFRWFEALIAIYWLYDRKPEQWLLDLATKLQAQGFHWGEFFDNWCYSKPTPVGTWSFMSHVVNHAMALKSHGLIYRRSGNERDKNYVYHMMKIQDRDHGVVTGIITGDECLAGKSPTAGTELCAVVEFAYSMEVLLSQLGDPLFGDRLEKVIFNALPATFSPDMWSHQYDQQVNQIECSIRPDRPWSNNGPESNIFGLEPNYGCCTANLSQGYPKYVANLWMKMPDEGGLVAMSYAPCEIDTTIKGIPVKISVDTDYPFRETIRVKVVTTNPVQFSLKFRIPGWANGATITEDGNVPCRGNSGSFYIIDRVWNNETNFTLQFPMQIQLTNGYHNAVTVERGPLVFALKIAEEWKQVHKDVPGREIPHADWEIYPKQLWNYALQVCSANLKDDFKVEERPVGDCPFSPEGAPVIIKAQGKITPEWVEKNGSAGEIPDSPVNSEKHLEEILLIPYGCTNLRITEFPLLKV